MPEPGRVRKGVGTVVFMFLITLVFISALTLVNLLTRERVERNQRLVLRRAILYSAGLNLPESKPELSDLYEQSVREIPDARGGKPFFEVTPPGRAEPAAIVVIRQGPGLWGEIEAGIGYAPDLRRLTGIDFIKQNETPGLGARISESWFKEQFRGKRGPFRLVPEGVESGENEFQAITGATNTSNAVRELVNRSIEEDLPRIEAGRQDRP
jgi:Na+-transporting NADH:ubiquinone oxidoreductase subunit C